MAQSPVRTSWGLYEFDLTQLLGERGSTESPASVVSTPMTEMRRVLSAWRAADRLLADHIDASPERSAIQAELVELRATYHRLFGERCRRPSPAMQLEVYGWRAGVAIGRAGAS